MAPDQITVSAMEQAQRLLHLACVASRDGRLDGRRPLDLDMAWDEPQGPSPTVPPPPWPVVAPDARASRLSSATLR